MAGTSPLICHSSRRHVIIKSVTHQPLNDDETPAPWFLTGWKALVLAMLLALTIRSIGLSSQSFSSDELIDLDIARQSWSAILWESDGFPPLHHWLLKIALLLTENDMVGRWLSVAYGVLAVPLAGLLGWRVLGKNRGTVAAWVLAIAPMHVYFSQEGRSYSLFFLLTTLATWLFWRALQTNSPRAWAAFAVAASVGGYVHYYFCFLLFAFAILWLKQAWAAAVWRPGLIAFLGIGLLSLPLLAIVGYDIGRQQEMRQGDFQWAAIGYTGWTLLAGFCLGPSVRELHSMNAAEALRGILPWLLSVGTLAGCLLASLMRKSHPYRTDLLVLLILPVACACVAAAGFEISSYNVRYAVPSLLPLVLLLAIALTSSGNQKISLLLSLIFVTVSAVSLTHRHYYTTYQNEDSHAACQFIVANSTAMQPVFTIAHYMEEPARYYLPPDYQVIPLREVLAEGESFGAAVEQINQQTGIFWVFYSRAFHGDPAGRFKQLLLNSPRISHQGTWAGVELYRGVVPLDAMSE